MSRSRRLLDLTAGKVSWCCQFRLGLLAIDGHERDLIAQAMGAIVPDPGMPPPRTLRAQARLPL